VDSNTIGKKNNSKALEMEVPAEGEQDHIKDARDEYGRHFGVCGSYHHLKACVCKYCPTYPGGLGMFCSRGKSPIKAKKEDCLCESCELVRKLGLESKYFCRQDES
jgi:hypothetical protein